MKKHALHKQENQERHESTNGYEIQWLRLHRLLLMMVCVCAPFLEALSMVLYNASGLTGETNWAITLFYLIAYNVVSLLIGFVACATSGGARTVKRAARFIVSLCFAAVCLIFYFAAGAFSSVCAPLFAAIVITIIYGDSMLTSCTFALTFFGYVLGKLAFEQNTVSSLWLTNPKTAINFLFTALMLFLFYLLSLSMIRFERRKTKERVESARLNMSLQQEILVDALTGLQNRRALRDAFDNFSELPKPIFFMMCDLNNFKRLNDTYGHQVGDECLRFFAQVLQRHCAPFPVYRYGGDEFCVLFSGISRFQMAHACEESRRELEASATQKAGAAVSASFGVAEYKANMTISDLVSAADTALYEAKARVKANPDEKNRICYAATSANVAASPTPEPAV